VIWAKDRQVRLGALFKRRDETGHPEKPLLSVYRDYGVTPRDGRGDNYNKPGENLDAYRVVHSGDLVLNKMKTWQGSLGISAYDGIVSPAYFVAQPLTEDSPAYLHHLLRSRPLIAEYAARSKGIRPSQWDLPWDEFRDISVVLPPLRTQLAVADYLDRQTARIDALIAARQKMIGLIKERFNAVVSAATMAGEALVPGRGLPSGWTMVPLKRCLSSMTYGIGAASQSEGDCGVLGMGNIDSGAVVGRPGSFVTGVEGSLLLRPGDLLFNRTNSRELVGKVGIVHALDGPTTFASYLVRLRTSTLAEPEYLNFLLNTPEVLGLARSMALPSIGQANLNPSRYSSIHLPIPPKETQRRIAVEVSAFAAHSAAMQLVLGRQIDLFAERRHSLVAAALTGQLDIPETA
jgi:type I restriction enzyme S subunit